MSGLIQRAKVKPATWRVGRVGAVVLWPRAKAGCAAMLTANAAAAQKATAVDLLIEPGLFTEIDEIGCVRLKSL